MSEREQPNEREQKLIEAVLIAIEALVESPDMPWSDKHAALEDYAEANGYDANLEEFITWFDEGIDESQIMREEL